MRWNSWSEALGNLGGLGVLLVIGAVGSAAQGEPPAAPVPVAHAHNDYAHARPLDDALAHGFCSVEADIFLTPQGLLVGHERRELRPDRTLEALYLDPLKARAKQFGGPIHPSGAPFYLLIDVKTDAEATYAALHPVLARYDDLLSATRDGRFERRAVTIVLSGNRARDTVARQSVRYVGIDGRPEDLDSTAPADLVPWISANWNLVFAWRGEDPLAAAERAKLNDFVARAHARGRQVRFWATPEKPVVWQELLAAGVDWINTDQLAELERFWRSRAAAK